MTDETMRVEVGRFKDKRYKLLIRFFREINFREHSDGSFTWVPKKSEIEQIRENLEMIDAYNEAKFLYKYLRPDRDEK